MANARIAYVLLARERKHGGSDRLDVFGQWTPHKLIQQEQL